MEKDKLQIRFAGVGGQGMVTLGSILAQAACLSGLSAACSQSYGSRARGGASRADVIVSRADIDYPHVERPDYLICLAQEAFVRYGLDIEKESIIIYDNYFVGVGNIDLKHTISIEATKIATDKLGNKIAANFIMLGALVGITHMVSSAIVMKAIEQLINLRFQELNKEAFRLGFELGEKYQNKLS